jgi:hypothetical protein
MVVASGQLRPIAGQPNRLPVPRAAREQAGILPHDIAVYRPSAGIRRKGREPAFGGTYRSVERVHDMTSMEHSHDRPGRAHLFFGVALLVFGMVMLVERLASIDFHVRDWPFFVIAFGIWKLIDRPASGRVSRSWRSGVWLLFVGGWGLVTELHLYGLDYDRSWPLVIVGAGLMLVWRSFDGPAACHRPQER